MHGLRNGREGRNRCILVVDDNESTHRDFRKILADRSSALDNMEALLFDEEQPVEESIKFNIDSAFQGEQGWQMVQRSVQSQQPYDIAIVDFRMPPGWDGIETIAKIWETDPDLQIVLCSAHLGQSREEVVQKLGRSEGLFFLPKPFENAAVIELASTLTRKGPSSQPIPLTLPAVPSPSGLG